MANPASAGNAVIAKVNLGVIRDCTNSADTEVTVSGSLIFRTLVAQNGGTLERCINYGNVTVTQTASASSGFYGGGLAAIGHTVLGTATATQLDVDETCRAGNFVDCENHGNLTIQCAGAAPIRSGFGGICGIVYMNGVRFTGCENYGTSSGPTTRTKRPPTMARRRWVVFSAAVRRGLPRRRVTAGHSMSRSTVLIRARIV